VLLRVDGDGVVAIGQASHAWISGQIARAWSPAPEPFEEVCLAAEQHDVGMAQWDLRPTLNPSTGRPTTFLELPVSTHIGLWSAAPGRLLAQSRYAALLVSMHGTALQGLRDLDALSAGDRELVTGYMTTQRQLQSQLIEQLGLDRDRVARNQRLIWAWDSFSLAVCLRWPEASVDGIRLKNTGPDRFSFDPWPLAVAELKVRCEGLSLSGRFASEPELHLALDAAPIVQLRFTISPERASTGSGSAARSRRR
jgi:hypothetical protein